MTDSEERRRDPRCVKDVGMHCSYLNSSADQLVTVRNFSRRGFYFESGWNIKPGAFVVLRAMDAHDVGPEDRWPRFKTRHSDPEACSTYRSHTLAMVQRSVMLERHDDPPLFGIGAEVQILNE